MTEFWATGQKSPHYAWDDLTQAWIENEMEEKGSGITTIKPRQSKGPGS